jgi:branched-subunit amino acid permease
MRFGWIIGTVNGWLALSALVALVSICAVVVHLVRSQRVTQRAFESSMLADDNLVRRVTTRVLAYPVLLGEQL